MLLAMRLIGPNSGGGGESGVRRVYVRLLRTALLQDAENKNCSGLV